MVASQGDSSRSGWVQGGGLDAIREYFQQRACKHCNENFTADGIELVRQEPGVLVVKVGCGHCGRPLGIALVGMNAAASSAQTCAHGRPVAAVAEKRLHPADWSKKDIERLSGKAPIGYDDVLSAHEFFSELGSNWSQHLPKLRRKS